MNIKKNEDISDLMLSLNNYKALIISIKNLEFL